jgi:bifunctional non-homologous end joining protein LigD
MMSERMAGLEQKTYPFDKPPAEARRGAVWLRPDLVAEIAYADQTADGRLRHTVFLGLREDKPAREVQAADRRGGPMLLHGVRLTNPDRVLFPDQGITKRQLAEYYAANADLILPFLGQRPLSLVRCPSGRGGKCFFQKHRVASTPDDIKTVMIEEKDGERAAYLLIDSERGLIAAAQIGALELHVWGARADCIAYPERLVFDLDPDESLDFAAVRAAAAEMRDVLAAAGLTSFALLTGGKGVHVIVPLVRRRGWDDVKAFARGLARKLAAAAPDRYLAAASKARRKGRIFVDWMRNERGATAIAPYSTRARPGAPLAMPVTWQDLARTESAASFTLDDADVLARHRGRHPWADYHRVRQTITRAHLDFVR